MSLSELCSSFISSAKLKDESERNIIEFAQAPWGLGMGSVNGVPPLYPGQIFELKCYYNIPLDDKDRSIIVMDRFNEKELYRFTEIEYLSYLWNEGRINVKEITGNIEDCRQNLLLVVGRRGFKTSTIAVLVAYETYRLLRKFHPQAYYRIMPDDEIRISCIATRAEQAGTLFNRITGHLERSDYFAKYRNDPTAEYMQLSTQRDIEEYGEKQRPSIKVVAAPCSSRGLRSHNNIVVIFDEFAYFFEEQTSSDKSDTAIYEAVTPSIAGFNSPEGNPHGRVIAISSPAARQGKFHELYELSLGPDGNNWLMIKAPTWEINSGLSSKYLRGKYIENPFTYMVEYGAEFSDRIAAWIDNEQILRVNIIPGLKEKTISYERTPHFMGIDLAQKNDGTAIAICHVIRKEIDGVLRNIIELDAVDVRYASEEGKEFLHLDDLADWIKSYTEKFFITKGVIDQWGAFGLLPLLKDRGLNQIEMMHMSRDLNSQIYQNLMSHMIDGTLRIPEGNERMLGTKMTTDLPLVTELLSLRATIHSKYLVTVEAPQVKGAHDDMSSAYSRAVYLASDHVAGKKGITQNLVIKTSSASGSSYRQYALKAKRSALYTNRPSTSLMMEMSRNRGAGRWR